MRHGCKPFAVTATTALTITSVAAAWDYLAAPPRHLIARGGQYAANISRGRTFEPKRPLNDLDGSPTGFRAVQVLTKTRYGPRGRDRAGGWRGYIMIVMLTFCGASRPAGSAKALAKSSSVEDSGTRDITTLSIVILVYVTESVTGSW